MLVSMTIMTGKELNHLFFEGDINNSFGKLNHFYKQVAMILICVKIKSIN